MMAGCFTGVILRMAIQAHLWASHGNLYKYRMIGASGARLAKNGPAQQVICQAALAGIKKALPLIKAGLQNRFISILMVYTKVVRYG